MTVFYRGIIKHVKKSVVLHCNKVLTKCKARIMPPRDFTLFEDFLLIPFESVCHRIMIHE
jgi:hypothetical protein